MTGNGTGKVDEELFDELRQAAERGYDFPSLLLLIDAELEGADIQHTDRRGKLLHAARVNIRNFLAISRDVPSEEERAAFNRLATAAQDGKISGADVQTLADAAWMRQTSA